MLRIIVLVTGPLTPMLARIFIGVILLATAFWASLGVRIGETLPPHARLLANSKASIYATVPCVIAGKVQQSYVSNVEDVLGDTDEVRYEPFVEPMRLDEARAAGIKPDKVCADAGGFVEIKSWIASMLGLGRDRVTKDGDVLW
jgi:hypothetical protein